MDKEKFILELKSTCTLAVFSYAIIYYSIKVDRYICIAAFLNKENAKECYDNIIKKYGESTAKDLMLEIIKLDY